MVLISQLKEQILQGSCPGFLVFLCKKDRFLAWHYIKEISKRCSKNVRVVDCIEDLYSSASFLNDEGNLPGDLLVYDCDKLKSLPEFNLNGVIICSSLDPKLKTDDVCEVPEIEDWQLKDYLYSNCSGADEKDLDTLFELLKYSPNRLMIEVEKLSIFTEQERKYVVKELLNSNTFYDISNDTIYTLSNAICRKDVDEVRRIMHRINAIDIEPVGLVTILCNNFRNMLLIQGNPNPSPEKTGIPAKQFYAISHNVGAYTITQLMQILKELDVIDMKLKSGYLPVDWIIPYTINYILSM